MSRDQAVVLQEELSKSGIRLAELRQQIGGPLIDKLIDEIISVVRWQEKLANAVRALTDVMPLNVGEVAAAGPGPEDNVPTDAGEHDGAQDAVDPQTSNVRKVRRPPGFVKRTVRLILCAHQGGISVPEIRSISAENGAEMLPESSVRKALDEMEAAGEALREGPTWYPAEATAPEGQAGDAAPALL